MQPTIARMIVKVFFPFFECHPTEATHVIVDCLHICKVLFPLAHQGLKRVRVLHFISAVRLPLSPGLGVSECRTRRFTASNVAARCVIEHSSLLLAEERCSRVAAGEG